MSLNFNNGCANLLNTPGIISDLFANRPGATDVAIGTLFIATDTGNIYRSNGSSWVTIGGGGGGSQDLQQTLLNGYITDQAAQFLVGSDYTVIQSQSVETATPNALVTMTTASGEAVLGLTDIPLQSTTQYRAYAITYFDNATGKYMILDFLNTSLNQQTVKFPENDGTIALQDPVKIVWDFFTAGNLTISIGAEQTFVLFDSNLVPGGGSIDLDPSSWKDQITAILMIQSSALNLSLTTSGGALLYGSPNLNKEGLVFIKYDQNSNAFYSSHY